MRILSLDTATEACSVAIHNTELGHQHDNGIFEICPQQHSQQILPMIDTLLTRNELSIKDIDLIAYGRGPGSFTGVRIAASTAQGLAFGNNVPVAEISTLAAMAQQNYAQYNCMQTISLIDARMQEVYLGFYEIQDGIARLKFDEAVLPPKEAAALLIDNIPSLKGTQLVGTGYKTYLEEFLALSTQQSNISSQLVDSDISQINVLYPDAKYMLPLALYAIDNNNTVKAEKINPVYVRDTVTWKKLPHKA